MPQLPQVAASGDVWGANLNNFLKQLQNGTTGAINHAATRPNPTGLTDGFTMIDTTTREIIKWNGTGWDVLMGGLDKGREKLSSNKNIYINGTSGDDNNDGLTAATAFKTLERSVVAVYSYDLSNFNITINIAAGTYLGRFDFDAAILGANGSSVTIKGAGSGSTTLQINASFGEGAGLIQNSTNTIFVTGVKLEAIGSSGKYLRGLSQYGAGTIQVSNDVNFGNFRVGTNSEHMYADGGRIYISSNYTVSGGAAKHFTAVLSGHIPTYTSGPFTSIFINNPIFDDFAVSELGLIVPELFFTGSASVTSLRANAFYNGVIGVRSGWPGSADSQTTGGVVFNQ
jgi:hypothetical protein